MAKDKQTKTTDAGVKDVKLLMSHLAPPASKKLVF